MAEKARHFVRSEKIALPAEDIKPIQLKSKLTVKEGGDSLDEVTISDGNRTVLLNRYLPEFVRFNGRRGNHFKFMQDILEASDPSAEGVQIKTYSLVLFPPEKTDTLEGRVALLQEIGHAMRPRNEKAGRYSHHVRIALNVISKIRDTEEYKNIDPNQQASYVLQIFQERWNEINKNRVRQGEDPITNNMLLQAVRFTVRDERESSANGIKLYRRILKEDRIDILDGATSDDIFKIISEMGLRSHEETCGFLLSLTESGGDH